jgi:DNA-binding CsgD family transcriptional regulator
LDTLTTCATLAQARQAKLLALSSSHEIWARVLWAAVDTAEQAGLDVPALVEGLSFDAVTMRRRSRVPWDEYGTVLERIEMQCGGPRELEDLFESGYHTVLPELRVLAGAVVTPMAYLRFIFDVIDPLVFAPIQFAFAELGPDRARITAVCRPGVPGCLAFFRASVGATRGMTRTLGLPPTRIDVADVTETSGTYEVTLPSALGWRDRGRRAGSAVRRLFMRAILGANPDGTPLAADIGEPEVSPVDQAAELLQLTPRQAEVLGHVAEGRSNKEIAQELGTAENTIELHVSRILRKAGVSSRSQLVARLWSRRWGFPQ